MISFDEETLYELADQDYGLDVWVLLPSHAANEMIENAVHSNSSLQAGTAAIAAISDYMREHIKLLEQTARLFAKAQKHSAANKMAAEGAVGENPSPSSLPQPALRSFIAQRPLIYKGIASRVMVRRQFFSPMSLVV
jgi:hypothetical protein